ncbi:bacteriohemerythrin [candidate division KSB1 bacterium]
MSVKWDTEYETGVRLIDLQHKNFTQKLDKLIDAVEKGRGMVEVSKMIAYLSDYINSHFELEEKYMRDYNYPEAEFHRSQHLKFKTFLKEIKDEYVHKRLDSGFIKYCKEQIWVYFVEHITVIDTNMARFLKSKGAV